MTQLYGTALSLKYKIFLFLHNIYKVTFFSQDTKTHKRKHTNTYHIHFRYQASKLTTNLKLHQHTEMITREETTRPDPLFANQFKTRARNTTSRLQREKHPVVASPWFESRERFIVVQLTIPREFVLHATPRGHPRILHPLRRSTHTLHLFLADVQIPR